MLSLRFFVYLQRYDIVNRITDVKDDKEEKIGKIRSKKLVEVCKVTISIFLKVL